MCTYWRWSWQPPFDLNIIINKFGIIKYLLLLLYQSLCLPIINNLVQLRLLQHMLTLILKLSHNARFKDTAAVLRGVYRVSEGLFPQSHSVRSSSWMDDPIPPTHQTPPIRSSTSDSTLSKLDNNKSQSISNITQQSVGLQTKINYQQTNSQLRIQKQPSKIIIQTKEPQPKSYLKQFKERPIAESQKFTPQVSSIPSSRIGRIFQFSRLGISLASASIFSKGRNEEFYKDVAEKVSNQLCKMRGAPLKLAQMLSIQQDDLIPAPIRRAFEKARESAHVIPKEEVEYMMSKNFGEEWRNKFKQFDEFPFASASIGQVHRATLLDGSQVAVKIQYNQVKQSISSDIQNLGLVMKIPGIFPKGMYVQRILQKTKQQLMQQCDYLLQKFYQQKYEVYLKKSFGQQSELFKVPKIYSQFTTPQILTSAYLSGIKMKNLEQEQYSQQIRDEIGRRIMKLTFKQLFQMGIMQSDPNPSNFTYNHKKDELNLFDFGATHIYKKQFLQNYYKIIEGSVKQDHQQIWEASIRTGFVTNEQNMAMKNNHVQSIMITGQPLRHKGKYDFGCQQITSRIYKTIPLMLKNRLKAPPEQVYSLHRKLSGSYLACIRLKARVDCSQIFNQIKFQTMASQEKYDPAHLNSAN